ncbi:MAG TPA: recombinase zinc beta ribbon domain-containing protein [Acidimicrobiales bacterium]|nr:recombinase zinc beta ribbon domain-containing protein [Acidimicrobiales bacterium]
MAPVVQRMFRLRAEGGSHPDIEAATGVKYSTVRGILLSRIYLGEVLLNDSWYPGNHEAIITAEEFGAAQRAHAPGRRRSRDVLSGRVRCGLCGRAASVHYNRKGRVTYRCRHRGRGGAQPIRSARGLLRAALLGLGIIAEDKDVQDAIRQELRRAQGPEPKGRARAARGGAARMTEVSSKRRKLPELYYSRPDHGGVLR